MTDRLIRSNIPEDARVAGIVTEAKHLKVNGAILKETQNTAEAEKLKGDAVNNLLQGLQTQ